MPLTLALPANHDLLDVLIVQSHRALDASLRSFDLVMSSNTLDAIHTHKREYDAAWNAHRVAVHYLKEITR